jgi:hypothetical protein
MHRFIISVSFNDNTISRLLTGGIKARHKEDRKLIMMKVTRGIMHKLESRKYTGNW